MVFKFVILQNNKKRGGLVIAENWDNAKDKVSVYFGCDSKYITIKERIISSEAGRDKYES